MMRVAIAGTGGLAYLLAHYLHEKTGHAFVLLSRGPKPHLVERGFQVIVVNYDDPASLRFALAGITVVLSTVTGPTQFKLIDAAIHAGVQRFAPAEFEGPSSIRPVDALDRSKRAVLNYLHQYSDKINYTSFVCGVLYERFSPGGLYASNMGLRSGISEEGDYLMSLQNMSAEVPLTSSANQPVVLCMTAAQDVAQFVVKSLEMPSWPSELTMCGERMTTQQLVAIAERVRGKYFFPNITWHNFHTMQQQLSVARASGNEKRYGCLLHAVATQEGRHDFATTILNNTFPDITPLSFEVWLSSTWAGR